MNEAELRKARAAFIDNRQDALLKTANDLEKKLFDLTIEKFVELFEVSNGNIKFNGKNLDASAALEKVFDEFAKIEQQKFATQFVSDIRKISDLNIKYNELLANDLKAFRKVASRVEALMKQRLGIGENGKLLKNGYLDSFIKDTSVKTIIREKAVNAVTKEIPIRAFVKELRTTILGTPELPGVIENKFKNAIFDVYQQHDRATSKMFAENIGLTVFVYSGGLIETSRKFCIERNNKAFTREEAEEWINDPDLPKTKAERDAGAVLNYDPVIDCGRWNCRHHVNFVSNAQAKKLRPDLEGKI